MTFLNKLFDKRPTQISDSSRKLYISNLKKLNNGNEPTDFIFLYDSDDVLKKIQDKKQTTQRTYIIAICSLLSHGNGPVKMYDTYYKILSQMNKDLAIRTTKSDAQKENWLTQSEISKIYENIEMNVKLMRASHITKKDYTTVLSMIVLALFTKIPPRRNVDYTLMKISLDMSDTKFNYIDLKNKKLIFNNYKTQKKYNQVIVDVPADLADVITKYMKFHPEKNKLKNKKHDIFFLVNYDGSNLSNSNDITKILNAAFGQKVGSSLLRNIYLTNKYSNVMNDLKDDAHAMSTSVDVALSTYIKKA
jgi:integrase